MPGLKTYSLLNCTVFFGLPLEGFGEGDALTVEPRAESWTATEGVDGSIARAATGSKSLKVKIRLLQTSPHNAVLTAMYNADTTTPGGAAVPFAYKDQQGADLVVADAAWIVKPPTMARGNKVNTTEWEIETGPGKIFHGGN